MIESVKCRHGKPHYEHCDQCGAEYLYLERYRARIKQTNDALGAIERLGE